MRGTCHIRAPSSVRDWHFCSRVVVLGYRGIEYVCESYRHITLRARATGQNRNSYPRFFDEIPKTVPKMERVSRLTNPTSLLQITFSLLAIPAAFERVAATGFSRSRLTYIALTLTLSRPALRIRVTESFKAICGCRQEVSDSASKVSPKVPAR